MLLPQPDFSIFWGHIDADMETKNFRRLSTGRNGETNLNSKETLKRNRSFSTIKALLKPFWASPETPGHFQLNNSKKQKRKVDTFGQATNSPLNSLSFCCGTNL